jgi:hypothetical protein
MPETISLPIPVDAGLRAELVIHKYPLASDDFTHHEIEMPAFSRVLGVQLVDGKACIFAIVNPNNAPVTRRFAVVGTGCPIREAIQSYLGTVQIAASKRALVFHIFEVSA